MQPASRIRLDALAPEERAVLVALLAGAKAAASPAPDHALPRTTTKAAASLCLTAAAAPESTAHPA